LAINFNIVLTLILHCNDIDFGDDIDYEINVVIYKCFITGFAITYNNSRLAYVIPFAITLLYNFIRYPEKKIIRKINAKFI
jgi:hypothetical protein